MIKMEFTKGDCNMLARILQGYLAQVNLEISRIDEELDPERLTELSLHFDSVELLKNKFEAACDTKKGA